MPCPAVNELMESVRSSIPFLAGTYREHNGQFLPRLQWRAGGGLNRHDAGLALDIILFASVASQKVLAENLVATFVDFHDEMRWQSVIYENVAVSSSGVPIHYTQDRKHYTHVHIDWFDYGLYEQAHKQSIPWPPTAYTRGFSSVLSGALNELNAAWLGNELSSINLMQIPRVIVGPITAG